jgi:hypothetical protein
MLQNVYIICTMVQLERYMVGEGEQGDKEIHDMSIHLRLSLYRSEHIAE